MRYAAVALLLLIQVVWTFTPVEAETAKEKLIGTWVAKVQVDEAKLKDMLGDMDLDQKQFDAILEQVKSKYEKITISLTFNADGTTTAHIGGVGEHGKGPGGRWEIVEEKGQTVTVKSSSKGKKEVTMTLKFDDDGRFAVEDDLLGKAPIKELIFARKKDN